MGTLWLCDQAKWPAPWDRLSAVKLKVYNSSSGELSSSVATIMVSFKWTVSPFQICKTGFGFASTGSSSLTEVIFTSSSNSPLERLSSTLTAFNPMTSVGNSLPW